ncbi:MAG TPA: hypothetical protein VKD72_34295 [Gemmataceae bacterium]|nr:hypothetical protein [Gemmataceae bacterium]
MRNRRSLLLAGLVALLGPAAVHAADPPPGPAYQIVLRSRHAEVTPTRTRDAQTGGGWIVVEQPEPNTIVVTMGGSAVVGSDFHGSSASIDFNLEQDLDIIATRQGVRPPRVGMVGRLVGTLQVTEPCKCFGKPCGTAEQGPATASLSLGDVGLLSVAVKPSGVSCGQESSINFRDGPVEAPAAPGCYHLVGSFRLSVNQGKGVFNRQAAVADFDPAPQLDAFWSDALKPFRAVPRQEFGFKIVLRVVEDTGVGVGAPK